MLSVMYKSCPFCLSDFRFESPGPAGHHGRIERPYSGAVEGVDCYGEECLKCSHLGGKCKILIDSAELRMFFAKISGESRDFGI